MRLPGEPDEYRRARDELLNAEIALRRQTEAVAAMRRELPLGGEVPVDYVFDGDAVVRCGCPSSSRTARTRFFLYSFMFLPRASGRSPTAARSARRSSTRSTVPPARDAAHQLRRRRKGADRAVPRPRAVEGMASRPAAVLVRHHLQPRLRRGRGRRRPASDRHRVPAPRRTDQPLLEQRALRRAARSRPAPASRRLHVAAVGDLRPCSRRPGAEWTPELEYGSG